ncbi:MAG: PAS domain-containing protein [Proteobacteria bacterium]|nr:PAS domain-containing protein [Pseudomonadota bacterium]
MAVITNDHQAEQEAILPKLRRLRLLRWFAAVLAVAAGATCLLLLLVWNDIHGSFILSAAALALAANAGLAVAALMPDARDAQVHLLSEMMGQSGEGQMVTGRDGRVLYMNKAAEGFFGEAGLEVNLGQLAGDDGAVAQTLGRLQADALAGTSSQGEFRLTLPNGKIHGLELRVHPIGNPADKVAWYLAEATARQELREVLRNEQALLMDFLDNAPVGFYSVDQAGQFILSNNTLANWLGYRPDELAAGQDLRSIVVNDSAILLPGQGSVQGDTEGAGHSNRYWDVTFQARNGDTFQAQVTQSVVGDAAKGEARTRSVVRNLSLERERRSALQTAERRFREFFDHAPVSVLLLDAEAVILEANITFAALLPEGETAVERSLFDFVNEDDRKYVARQLQAAWANEPSSGPLEVALFAGPQRRQMELYASGMTDAKGGVSGILLHLIDNTSQRNLELQFAQSQKMQAVGQLAGGVAHDFNNLLTAMIGHCDLLLLRARPGDETFPDIMQVKQNANRAANLVRQLLAFSRQQTLRPKVLSLTDVLAELTHLVRRLIGENIELRIEHGRDLGLVKVDQGQFEQVVINLAVNARDAMTGGGILQISTANVSWQESLNLGNGLIKPDEYIKVQVKDTGKGIKKEDMGRIFEPFFTTKLPGTGAGSGTGLGLSTVFGIVKQTGGYIFPESDTDAGTTFSIYLPRYIPTVEDVATTNRDEDDDERPKDLTGKGIILLVEDEEAVRMFAARALRNKGYTVLEADCGESALALFNEQKGDIDLLVSDVVMPQMDGPTLIREVRKQRPDLKVIFISGYAEEAFRRNLDPDSEFELLPKPFSLKQLAGRVKDVIGA